MSYYDVSCCSRDSVSRVYDPKIESEKDRKVQDVAKKRLVEIVDAQKAGFTRDFVYDNVQRIGDEQGAPSWGVSGSEVFVRPDYFQGKRWGGYEPGHPEKILLAVKLQRIVGFLIITSCGQESGSSSVFSFAVEKESENAGGE